MREEVRLLRSSRKKLSAAIAAVAVSAAGAAVTLGSPGLGFVPTNLVTGSMNNAVKWNSDRVKFQTKGPTDTRVQKIEIAPGGFSGWHHHPGVVIVTVATGAVTFMQSDCSSTTYGPGLPAGSAFVEGGDDPGQASSTNGATVYATFVAPHANPPVFRIEDDPPPCA
jgi:hypothetical protein